MTRTRIPTLLILILVCACSTPESCLNYIECPDGMGSCRDQAKELCPAGYRQLSESDTGPDFGDFAKQTFPGASSGVPHIIAACNP